MCDDNPKWKPWLHSNAMLFILGCTCGVVYVFVCTYMYVCIYARAKYGIKIDSLNNKHVGRPSSFVLFGEHLLEVQIF